MDRPPRASVRVVVKNQRAIVPRSIRIRKHVLVDRPMLRPEVVHDEVGALRKHMATLQQRRNLLLVARRQRIVRPLVHARPLVLHAVPLGVALDLPMPEHRQPRQRRHQRRHAEAFVARPELIDRRSLVRVRHKVHVPLQNVRIKLDRLLQVRPVLRILLVPQHIHERAVVHPMHAKRPNEVPLQHPERLRQQQRSRHLHRHPVHHLPPELMRHQPVELLLRHRRLRPRRNRSANPGQRKPQPLHMALRQRHRGVEANDGKQARHMQNGLDHLLPHICLRVVQLRRIVPGKGRSIVAVIHKARLAIVLLAQPEHHGSVRLVEIVILNLDLDARVTRKIRPFKTVRGKRALRPRDKPVRMLNHPRRIDPHVVRHHVAGQPNARLRRAIAKRLIRHRSAKILRDLVVLQRVGRRHRILLPAQPLDRPRRHTALPQPDQPQPGHAPLRQQLQLLIGNLVQPMNVPPVLLRQLLQPHIRALRHQHHCGHPRLVLAEGLILDQRRLVVRRIAPPPRLCLGESDKLIANKPRRAKVLPASLVHAPRRWRMEAHPDRNILFAHYINRQQSSS